MDNFGSFMNDHTTRGAKSEHDSDCEEINSILRNENFQYSKYTNLRLFI